MNTVVIAMRVTIVTLVVTGLLYPAIVTGLANVLFPSAAAGSLVRDAQGRVVVPALVRTSAGIEGEVAVLGALDHLEVWSNARFLAQLDRDPFTDDDQRALAALGI